ncbi:hypothetical protein ULMA_11510 [Patiriisocius marinus]|uniref:Peptidase S8/S53 domain-containing protein n=1 Tax=Patiriisocius marinus TaxID=1397112 RepID=A0A5J4IZX1_9FLAO|nr:S8 family serine peptidase [Patiriisocius marinus]GER59043.1 hypothetical protein ULMA_11510 [Patiriisocius marinus]
MSNNNFATKLNSKNLFEFKQLYPTAETPRLKRVYLIALEKNSPINDVRQSVEVNKFNLIIEDNQDVLLNQNFTAIPDDYIDIITGGRSTSLDLIKAPLAWTVTTGDPNTLVGVVDTNINNNHEDLGQIHDNIIINQNNVNHGLGVTSAINANTGNNLGMASLGYDLSVVFATAFSDSNSTISRASLINGLLQLSQYPGVRVINCSWIFSENSPFKEDLDEVIAEVEDNGVLVVAGAGNSNSNTYYYPASYDSTISVTSVGSRVPIGEDHNLTDPYGTPFWWSSWQDCHAGRPEYGQGGHTRNDKVDVTAPGILTLAATEDYAVYPMGYSLNVGTSGATPYVTALAGLLFSINPNFTPAEVKDIIKDTADDIYYIPYNQQYLGLIGTGRINAFRAVKTADCIVNPKPGLDLAMQNSEIDLLMEPDIETDFVWRSKDIFVRNQDDGDLISVHQNPEYSDNLPNFVYVRITNNSCITSDGTDNLRLYWAKANTELTWPLHWTGDLYITDPVTNQDILMGNEVGVMTIPILEPGESKLIKFTWNDMPNPDDYENINPNKWHFCFLGRIDTHNDPMTFSEGTSITENVMNNNNIAWKNTTVVDIASDVTSDISGVIGVGNSTSSSKSSYLEFVTDTISGIKPLYEAAEIIVQMDNSILDSWENGGSLSVNFSEDKTPNNKIVNNQKANLNNIILPPNSYSAINISFNFLTDKKDETQNYTFHVIQRDSNNDEIIGGETYVINKYPRPNFQAEAGNNKEIDKDESVTISAAQINEAAQYNWYDPEGNLIYTGENLTVSPNVTKTYTLEIISDSDGYKDYDEVKIKVNPYKIESLAPNPSNSTVSINYIADEATSAYIMVVGTNNNTSNNYIIDPSLTTINLDVTNYENGIYAIALVCDGEIVSSKYLYKN